MITLASLDRIPPPLLKVHEALTDEDLAWVNRHLSMIGGQIAIRGSRDIPLPPPITKDGRNG